MFAYQAKHVRMIDIDIYYLQCTMQIPIAHRALWVDAACGMLAIHGNETMTHDTYIYMYIYSLQMLVCVHVHVHEVHPTQHMPTF